MQAQKLSSECNVADPGEKPASPPSGESSLFELNWRAAEFTADTAGAEAINMLKKLREMGVLDADEFEKKRQGLQGLRPDLTAPTLPTSRGG
jgi:hypothetical protein